MNKFTLVKIIFTLFLFYGISIYSQNYNQLLDSAKKLSDKYDTYNLKPVAEKIVEMFPDSSWGYYYKGIYYRYNSKLDSSLILLDKALNFNKKTSEFYNLRAEIFIIKWYSNRKKMEDAFQDIQTSLQLNPSSSETYVTQGLYYSMKYEHKNALKSYTKASELAPKNWTILYKVGETSELVGDTNKAIIAYTKLLEINPTHINSKLRRCALYLNTKRFAEAYNEVIQSSDDNFYTKGISAYYLGKYDESIANLTKEIENRNPQEDIQYRWDPHLIRGAAFKAKGEIEKACNDWNIADNKDVSFAIDSICKYCNLNCNRYVKIYAYLNSKDFEKTIKRITPMYLNDTNSVVLLRIMGDCYRLQEQYDYAAFYYNKAFKKNKEDDSLYFNYAVNSFLVGNDSLMELLFKKIKNKKGFQTGINFYTGYSYQYNGLHDKSIEIFKEVIAQNDLYYTNNAISGLAAGYYYKSDFKKAIEQYNLLIKKGITDDNYGNIGYILYKMKEYNKAIENFNQQIKLMPNNGRSYYYRALCNFSLGNNSAVCSDLEKSKNLNFEPEDKKIIDICK